jgi:selenide,water dikinase
LGTGVIGTALKKDGATKAAVDAAILSMCTLNRMGMELALPFEVHAATDITGFGLLGHGREMAVGSKVSFAIDSRQIEFLPEALDLAQKGFLPGGLMRNRDFLGGCVEFAHDVPENVRNLLFDPQTSGGLLLSMAPKHAAPLLESMRTNGVDAQKVGEVIERTHPLLQVR